MLRRPPEKLDPKEEAITRLIKAIRRGHDHFVNLLIQRDRLATAGGDTSGHELKLAQLDRDLTANEIQLKSLGYVPKHREKVVDVG